MSGSITVPIVNADTINVGTDPTSDTHASRKGYVDAQVSNKEKYAISRSLIKPAFPAYT